MRANLGSAVFASLILAACQSDPNTLLTREEAVEAANEFLAERYPQAPLDMLTIETKEVGENWQVSYNPPYDATGGPVVVTLDKHNGKVVTSSAEQ